MVSLPFRIGRRAGWLCALVLLAGCGTLDDDEDEAPAGANAARSQSVGSDSTGDGSPTAPTMELVTLEDPVEHAYSMDFPKGWSNETYTARDAGVSSFVDLSISPDGSVVIFQGDPSLPQYYAPIESNRPMMEAARYVKKIRVEPFQTAEQYFPSYVKRKFGKLPGFRYGSVEADPEMAEKLRQAFAEKGLQASPTCATVKFDFEDHGRTLHAAVYGSSIDSGPFWVVTVAGCATSGDPDAYRPMMDAMGKTRKMHPEWQAEQQRKHDEQMAQIAAWGRQMTANHEANMAWIQRSATAHQARMDAIHAAGDASTRAFNERMAAGDVQQRNFLNYIQDENTVVNSSGQQFQVDNSYDRYYRNKNTGKYIGGDSRMDEDSLRRLGVNPDDYEELKLRR